MTEPRTPPMLSIVGRKHAGKTTTVTRLSAELTRRGHTITILKHGSHSFNIDPAGTDTFRHFHEGNAARVAMVAPDKFAMVERWSAERGPEELAREFFSDADLVLCEGFTRSSLPKVEIHRLALSDPPHFDPARPNAASWQAMITDAPDVPPTLARFGLERDDWLQALTDWVEREFLHPRSS